MFKDNAVTPDRSALLKFSRDMQRLEKRQDDEMAGIDGVDANLAELATMPGWGDLKKFIEIIKRDLKPNTSPDQGMSDSEYFASIGVRMVFYEILANQFDRLINKVEGTRKVVNEKRAENRERKRKR